MYRKRLKNVYELLETGNNKKVIQEVDKLVAATANLSLNNKKKIVSNEVGVPGYDEQTTLIIAKALKALALVRTGRKLDSDKLIDELLDSKTTDENALSIIMQYCKETHQLSKIVAFYENAVTIFESDKTSLQNKQQDYEELLTSLFNAYTRNGDFKKQQQLALKLYKQTGKLMYSYWNAASYVLMAKNETKQEQKTFYLKLAEKLLEKVYLDKKMEFNGEFQLYLDILESLGKYSHALKIINEFEQDKHLAKIGHPNFKFNKQMFYHKNMNEWKLLKDLCEGYFLELKSSNLEDWTVYTEYVGSVINMLKSLDTTEQTNLIDQVFNFLKKLQLDDSKSSGPYLAQIELFNQLIITNEFMSITESSVEKLKLLFTGYLNMCSCQPGFFYEITKFECLIIKANLQDFILEQLKDQHDKSVPFTSIKSIYTCLSYWHLNRYFGKQENMSFDDLLGLAVKLEEYYMDGLPFGKDLLPTAFQYSDEFLIMATHIRYDMMAKYPNKTQDTLLSLISRLKFGLSKSPSNFQMKLTLLNLYSHLGAYDLVKKMYDSMEIKNIQYYSTSNLLLSNNIRLGSFESSTQMYATMRNFFTSSMFDLSSFMVNCYKYGTFLKVFEINSFINELKKSLSIHVCLTNYILLEIILDQVKTSETELDLTNDLTSLNEKIEQYFKDLSQISSVLNTDCLISSNNEIELIDHSDTNVLYDWSPTISKQKTKINRSNLIKEQVKVLKLGILFSKFVHLCVQNNEVSLDKFDLVKNELINFDFTSNGLQVLEIFNTKSNYLNKFQSLGVDKLMRSFLELVSDLRLNEKFLDEELSKADKSKLNEYKCEINKTFMTIETSLSSLFEETQEFKLECLSDIFESLSALLVTLSFVIICFVSCLNNSYYKPIWSEKCKKSKKKKGAYLKYSQSIDSIYHIYERISECIHKITGCFDKFKVILNRVDGVILKTSGLDNKMDSVDLSDLTQSYKKSIDEYRKVFAAKLKFMERFSLNAATQKH